jgi:CheY-like chemotaxis protein
MLPEGFLRRLSLQHLPFKLLPHSADLLSAIQKTPMKILIVDDSRFLRVANERALVKAGYEVITAADGDEGLRLAIEQKPDLVVLDMLLPKLSGPEVLRALRKKPETAFMPVMVLTSLPQTNEQTLLKEGATSYFAKSGLMVDQGPGMFVETVEKLLTKVKAGAASG